MTTKERILAKAKELYNQQGTDSITVRHIASELTMSHGNLCYHFPNTDSIIQALYIDLVEKLNGLFTGMETTSSSLQVLYDTSFKGFELLYEYRFLMLDFVRIMRSIPAINQHFKQLMLVRKLQMIQTFKDLETDGLIRSPLFPDQYELLTEHLLTFGDFWIARAEIVYEGEVNNRIQHYHRIFLSSLIPILTERGLEEWNRLFMSK